MLIRERSATLVCLLAAAGLLAPAEASAYRVERDLVDAAGHTGQSASYQLRDAVGYPAEPGRFLAASSMAPPVGELWSVGVDIANNALDSTSVVFGLADGATDGVDRALGEQRLPPLPIGGVFDVRFLGPAGDDPTPDLRDASLAGAVWRLRIRAGDGGYPVTLSWDRAELPGEGSFRLQDAGTEGGVVNLDMRAQATLRLEDPAVTEMRIVYAVALSHSYDLPSGWSMVSLPLDLEDATREAVFEDAISLYKFVPGPGYSPVAESDALQPGAGYWLNSAGPVTNATVSGPASPSMTISLPADWSLVGPGPVALDARDLQAHYSQVASVFGFGVIGRAYYALTGKEADKRNYHRMEPGYGYWIDMDAPAILDLSGAVATAARPAASPPLPEPYSGAVLWVESGRLRQDVPLGLAANQLEKLPPPPPPNVLDVRVEIDGKAYLGVPESEVGSTFTVRVQGQDATVGWDIPAADAGQWELSIGDDAHVLAGSGSVRVAAGRPRLSLRQVRAPAAQPRQFALGQNYPNPFNAATTISFEVTEEVSVLLAVYDLAGQRVRSLVRDTRVAGAYSVLWDGTTDAGQELASGVYLVRMSAGEWSRVRKMALVR